MFIIKKILTPFLLPPGIFVTILFCVSVILIFKKRFRAGLVSLTIGLLLWALAMPVTGDFLLAPLETKYTVPADPRGDVVVLLGGGAGSRAPDLTGSGVPSCESLVRLVTAVRLYRMLKIPIIMSGGKVYEKLDSDSIIMTRFLRDLGVPLSMIIEENRSRDTFENSRYTAEICSRRGFSRPLLVTSSFHMPRAAYLFEQAGLSVTPVPAGMIGTMRERFWIDYLPGSFMKHSIALKEYMALVYYRAILGEGEKLKSPEGLFNF